VSNLARLRSLGDTICCKGSTRGLAGIARASKPVAAANNRPELRASTTEGGLIKDSSKRPKTGELSAEDTSDALSRTGDELPPLSDAIAGCKDNDSTMTTALVSATSRSPDFLSPLPAEKKPLGNPAATALTIGETSKLVAKASSKGIACSWLENSRIETKDTAKIVATPTGQA
jgi:hypothetical protein